MPPKKTVTFHPDTFFIEKPKIEPKEDPKEDPAESELIEAVHTNNLITAKWLIITKNIRDRIIDEIVVVSEHYKAGTYPVVNPNDNDMVEYTLLDIAIINNNLAMAQLLLTYGARAISHLIKDDPDFLSILTKLNTFVEKLDEKARVARP